MDVDLRLLRSFVVVATELNFTKAAEELHISQPALSKQIRQLEALLKVTLLHRTSRSVRLSEAGKRLLEDAPALLASWDATFVATREAEAAENSELRVGFVASAANELTPRILARFSELRPGWRVSMSQAPWSDPTAGVLPGTSDAGLLRVPTPGSEQLHQRILITEPRWIALPSAHPLAASEVVRMDQLLDEPFVATPVESGSWRDYWLAADERGGHPIRIGAETTSTEEWLQAIGNGYGVSFTPAATARFYVRPGITYRPVEGVSPSSVAVVWRKDDARPVLRDFVLACVEVAREAA